VDRERRAEKRWSGSTGNIRGNCRAASAIIAATIISPRGLLVPIIAAAASILLLLGSFIRGRCHLAAAIVIDRLVALSKVSHAT
jgi:hypothetical protein